MPGARPRVTKYWTKTGERRSNAMELDKLERLRYYVGTTAVTLLMRDDQPLARGIAVCSHEDTFDLMTGDKLSYDRALEACRKERSHEAFKEKEARDEFIRANYIHLMNSGYRYFSEYRPVLVPRELEILGRL
jgi:hypothetical protein